MVQAWARIFTFALVTGSAAGSAVAGAVAPSALASEDESYSTIWENVAIGGGGYVLQTFFHAKTKHAYMKTDVGGIYRRNSGDFPGGFSWIPLLDWAGPSNGSDYSVNALAMHPDDGAQVTILTGGYWAYSNCSVLITQDAGDSWVVAPGSVGWGLTCGGNEGNRAVGERMSVHPTAPGTIAVGGADGGVWITTDGFNSVLPTRVALPAPASPELCIVFGGKEQNSSCVVLSVAWLPVDGVDKATLLLAAVPAHGIFASTGPDYTDPTTWSFVKGSDSPTNINRIELASGMRLWVTCAVGGVWSGTITGASSSGWTIDWSVRRALAENEQAFSGIAVRAGGKDVAAMTFTSNNNQSIYRSLDGGETGFHKVNWTVHTAVPWWGSSGYNTNLNAGASLAFEPDTNNIWATDFFGVYVATVPAVVDGALNFQNVETGHEEVCINAIEAPAVGAVWTGGADVGGWVHDQGLHTWPSKTLSHADSAWAHNCIFGLDSTLKLAQDKRSVDTMWITAGDEYGACHSQKTGNTCPRSIAS